MRPSHPEALASATVAMSTASARAELRSKTHGEKGCVVRYRGTRRMSLSGSYTHACMAGSRRYAFWTMSLPWCCIPPREDPPIEQSFVWVEDGILPLEVEVVLENTGEEYGPAHE